MQRYFFTFSLIIVFASQVNLCLAHGDLHERIQKVTKEIKAAPDSAHLYYKRGVLYYQHEEFSKSLKDLLQASDLDYSDTLLDLHFGKVYLELSEYEEALVHIDQILKSDENNVHAWKLKGKVHFEKEEYEKSADAYMQLLEKSKDIFPSNFLDASWSFELHGSEESKRMSVKIIEDGIQKLGNLMTFYQRLVQLHINYEHFTKAIEAQNQIITLSNRKEKVLFKRAEIHLMMGQKDLARQDFLLSKEAVLALPLRIQNLSAMKTLLKDIQEELSRL